jgi:DNA-binding ferritin-like protein
VTECRHLSIIFDTGPPRDELGDWDTADIFTEISRGVDKYHWFVEAHHG